MSRPLSVRMIYTAGDEFVCHRCAPRRVARKRRTRTGELVRRVQPGEVAAAEAGGESLHCTCGNYVAHVLDSGSFVVLKSA